MRGWRIQWGPHLSLLCQRNIDVRVFLSVQHLRRSVVLLVLNQRELFWSQHVFSVLTLDDCRVGCSGTCHNSGVVGSAPTCASQLVRTYQRPVGMLQRAAGLEQMNSSSALIETLKNGPESGGEKVSVAAGFTSIHDITTLLRQLHFQMSVVGYVVIIVLYSKP